LTSEIYPRRSIACRIGMDYIPINSAGKCIVNNDVANFALVNGMEIGMEPLNSF